MPRQEISLMLDLSLAPTSSTILAFPITYSITFAFWVVKSLAGMLEEKEKSGVILLLHQ